MKDTDAAYLAGGVDFDGCISISLSKKKKRDYHYLRVSIGTSCEATARWIASKFGVRMPSSYITTTGNEFWQVGLSGKRAQDMLVKLMPYMVTKKLQAELALVYPVGEAGKVVSESTVLVRESLRQALMQMHRGGA